MSDVPILVTGAAGQVGGVGRSVAENLLRDGWRVRALVRREDERSAALAKLGAEVVVGDLLDLHFMHQAVEGCARIYFGLSVGSNYLEATTNIAAVARHHGIEALVNISQMTVSQMSIRETTPSPQQKQHWLAEQVLNWSGLPVVHVRPTVFLDGFFLKIAARRIAQNDELALPFGRGRTSPIAGSDVARVMAAILKDPAPHIGSIYDLTGPASQDLDAIAEEYSQALGRPIRYVSVPVEQWRKILLQLGLPEHAVAHLATMALLHQENRYDRLTTEVERLTGSRAMTVREFVERNATAYAKSAAA